MYENKAEAELYDRLYQDRKDYEGEAVRVADLIREHKQDAVTLLDVACGTGLHLAAFAKCFDEVAGVDLSAWMADLASERLAGVPVHQGDMRTFDLGRTFDSVVCMFSSIGYLRTTEDLDSAVRAMTRHLADDGVLAIEPWYFPETFLPGFVSTHALKDGHQGISRVSHSTQEDNVTRMEIHYVIADADAGVQHRSEVDHLTLFSREEYENAFRSGGLTVEYVETGLGRPGFFVGTRTGRA